MFKYIKESCLILYLLGFLSVWILLPPFQLYIYSTIYPDTQLLLGKKWELNRTELKPALHFLWVRGQENIFQGISIWPRNTRNWNLHLCGTPAKTKTKRKSNEMKGMVRTPTRRWRPRQASKKGNKRKGNYAGPPEERPIKSRGVEFWLRFANFQQARPGQARNLAKAKAAPPGKVMNIFIFPC